MEVRFISQDKCWLATCALVSLEAIFSLTVPHCYLLTSFGDLTQCILLSLVFASALTNIRSSEHRSRLFWMLLAMGCGIWLCVQVLWTYFEVLLHREVPTLFTGDVVLFLHLVPMMGALAVQPDVERDEQLNRLGGVDFALLVIWWLYLYLFIVIPWQYVSSNKTLYDSNFNLVYSLEHVVFLACAAAVWGRSTGLWKRIYGHLFVAGAMYALASIAASLAIDAGRYYTGSFYDVPLVASMAWFGWAVRAGRHVTARIEPLKEARDKRSGWVSALAMITMLSLPIFAGWALYASDAPSSVRSFRIVLTLATMMLMGALIWSKQRRLDTVLSRVNQELREDSLTDVLTGTRNRRFLTSTIENDVRHVLRSYSSAASSHGKRNRDLIFYLIDSDSFKEVNDRYGHDIGDYLLVEIAARISSAIRHSDVLIRWGGDEFLVVSRYSNRDEAAALAMRVLNAIGSEPFDLKGGESIRRTCSIGWSVFPWFVSQPDAVSYENALRLADCALYEAKKAGRNQAIGMLPSCDQPSPEMGIIGGKHARMTEQLAARTMITPGPEPSENSASSSFTNAVPQES